MTFATVLPACAEPRLEFVSSLDWDLNEPWFGGFSAMEMDADGRTATLLTDRGALLRVRFVRTDDALEQVTLLSREELRAEDGRPLRGSFRDAEGLAIGPDGSGYVSFEFRHRVMRLDTESGRLRPLPTFPDFAGFPDNEGLEALAIYPDGTLFAMQEKAADQDDTVPLYSYRSGAWRISHNLHLTGPFVPVGADFDEAGHLFLLERAITPLGFRSRLQRFDLDNGRAEILLDTLPGRFDNLETISVWTDPQGRSRLTAISDDNFMPFQRTHIIEFVLTE